MKTSLPVILERIHLTQYPDPSHFLSDELEIFNASFDSGRQINISKSGVPLYLTRFRQPPTACQTPGRLIPAGYTPTGKYKPARWTSLKMDKRAGK